VAVNHHVVGSSPARGASFLWGQKRPLIYSPLGNSEQL